jgi:hypothetical protein
MGRRREVMYGLIIIEVVVVLYLALAALMYNRRDDIDPGLIQCSKVAQYGDVTVNGVWNCQMPNGDTCYITTDGIDCVQY